MENVVYPLTYRRNVGDADDRDPADLEIEAHFCVPQDPPLPCETIYQSRTGDTPLLASVCR